MILIAFVAGPALNVGCAQTVSSTAIGSWEPRPADCEIDFIAMDMREAASAMDQYDIVGSIGVSTRNKGAIRGWTDELRAEVRPEACALGGDTVSLMASSSDSSSSVSGATAYVLRRRPPAKVFGSAAFLDAREPELRKKAAFELECAETEFAIVDLGGLSRGVTGCGQRATYTFVRTGMSDGTWKRESP